MTSEESVNAKINAITLRWLPSESDEFNGLSQHEVDVVLAGAFATEYENGGLMQWFCNGPGEYADVVVRVLGEMGALGVQDVLKRFLRLFPDYRTKNSDERYAALTSDKQNMIHELQDALAPLKHEFYKRFEAWISCELTHGQGGRLNRS